MLAVSGGSDSLALLVLIAELSGREPVRFSAVTVDHGLRPEAADEAMQVASTCKRLGVPHTILKLNWPSLKGVSQAKARRARYAALSEHARVIGAGIILTGHTRDDQAETLMIRLNSGSGPWGLAGISALAAAPVWPEGRNILLARPLLKVSREALQSLLKARGMAWVSDPSNENPAFERVRMRRLISARPSLQTQLIRLQERYSEERLKLQAELKLWCEAHLVWHKGGAATLASGPFLELSEDKACRLLSLLLPCVSGQETGPRSDKIPAAFEALKSAGSVTLGGCRLIPEGGTVLIVAEDTSPLPAPLVSGSMLWQGRQVLTWREGAEASEWRVSSWGELKVDARYRDGLPGLAIRRTWPVLIDENSNVRCVPHLEHQGFSGIEDLGPGRLCALIHQPTEFFRKESENGESFSNDSSPMLYARLNTRDESMTS